MSNTVSTVRSSGGSPRQRALPFEAGPPVTPVAASLVAQARRGVAAARAESDVVERFTGAYMSALRAAAAVLAARGRPHRGRAKPQSVWSLLESAAPELSGWAAYFAAHSARHAAAQSGSSRGVDEWSAEALVEHAGTFVAVVDVVIAESLAESGAEPGSESGVAPRCASGARPARIRRR
ncbi:hypothetical protein BJF85_01470 [Saccharomonospora sp. CUA-673]|uniref:SAV_6107 family HEPN domain-containing protein n=1 Tax=Saccharomonospora sp. CUA-673 TaxID=1904969 RepID=UPI00096528C6|nr:SAV_6107 family HEPN domain-containing protein [Saccharomonospora sp. CUA-673]OLT45119.1 hypothetical protein BJF85_01470 [Saccharomonospora sp. CUA-673]